MTKPRLYKTEAIVLKRTPLGEADAIVTLYTPNYGKLRSVAKGVRRPRSKLGGHVEPLNHASFLLARGKTLDVVSQVQTIQSFLPLRQDLWRTTCALYTAELVESFTIEGSESYPVFRLLRDTLLWLCEAGETDIPLRYFELHLLTHLGYQPELSQCLNCRAPLRPERNYFSASGGGLLCPPCHGAEPVVRPLSLDALKVMRFLKMSDQGGARRLRMGPELNFEVEQALREYLRFLLERELKSVKFLDRLRREG